MAVTAAAAALAAAKGAGKAGFWASQGKNIAQSSMGDVASGLLGSAMRGVGYAANQTIKNLYPPQDQLITLYHREKITFAQMRYLMGLYGCDLETNERDGICEDVWRRTVLAAEPDHDPQTAVGLWRQGLMTEQQVRACLANNGYWRQSKQNQIMEASEYMSISDSIAMFRQEEMSIDGLRQRMAIAGVTVESEQNKYLRLSSHIGPADAYAAHMRGELNWANVSKLLIRSGIIKDLDTEQTINALKQTPGPSDLVRFAVREVWNREVVDKFGYDEEYETIPEFEWWCKAQGYTGSPTPVDVPQNRYVNTYTPLLGQPIEVPIETDPKLTNWARAFWRSHWELPSPTQGYQFLHRLRPDRMARYEALIPGVKPWTIDDMRLLLKTADYPHPFRDRLAAVSYHTLTRVDIRRLYDTDVIDEKEVYEQNLDAGYNQTDARALTTYIVKDRENRRLKKQRERERKRTIRLFTMGVIDNATAILRLEKLGLGKAQAKAEIKATVLDIEESKIALAVKSIHRQYVRWDVSREDAGNRLRRLGILPDAIQIHLKTWGLEREGNGRRSSASQIVRWVVRGVLKTGAAIVRLEAMGFPRPDAIRMLRIAQQDRAVLKARQDRAAATSAREADEAVIAEITALQRQVNAAQRALAKGGTPARLDKWYQNGLISEKEVRRRLLALGWLPEDIERFLGRVPPLESQIITPGG